MPEYNKETPEGVVEEARSVANQVAGQARDVARDKMHRGAERGASELSGLADALHRTSAGDLKNSFAAPYVDKLADQVERLSHYVENARLDEVVGSTERFARRKPWLFLGGAFALGLIGARFLKSSASQGERAVREVG